MSHIVLEILKTSLFSSVIIVLIVLLKNNFLKRYTYRFNYILCVILTFRMLFIYNIKIHLPVYIMNYLQLNNKSFEIIRNIAMPREKQNFINLIDIVFIIWAIGFVVVILKYDYINFKFNKKIENLIIEIKNKDVTNIYEEEKIFLKVKSSLKIYKVEGLSSPVLVGIINPKIYIPSRKCSREILKIE